jgi:hypothetical protein
MTRRPLIHMTALALSSACALGAERDMQYINIVGISEIIMIQNVGDTELVLDGWRFCTQNSTSGPVFSAEGALDGIVVPARGTFIIRYADDAIGNFPTHHNASDIGPLAPFDLDAYALSMFAPDAQGEVDFTNPAQMTDHMQWKRNHVPDSFELACADVAVDAGLWEDAHEWIYVRQDLYLIELTDRDFVQMHSPDDYNVILECRADFSDDGIIDFFDVSAFIGFFVAQDPIADLTRDGRWDFFDVSIFLQLFNQQSACPGF